MKSTAKTVDDYIRQLDPEKKEAFQMMRQIAPELLPAFKESMKYGMPTYEGQGKLAFAEQKHHISIYIHHAGTDLAIEKHNKDLGRFSRGKECIRYRKTSEIRFDAIRKILSDIFL